MDTPAVSHYSECEAASAFTTKLKMKMKKNTHNAHAKHCCLLAACLITPQMSQAALSVNDGAFSNPSVANGSANTNITNWYDEAGDTFTSFIFHKTSEFGVGTDQLLAFGSGNGYAYQSLGTRVLGEDTMTVSLDAYERPTVTRFFPTLEIDIYAGSFGSAANGTDINATLTSLGMLTLTGTNMFTTPLDGSDGESVIGFTVPGSVDLSGLAVGTEIWMRLHAPDATGTTSAVYIDNVSVKLSAVPEPSSAALLSLGGLALILHRRK